MSTVSDVYQPSEHRPVRLCKRDDLTIRQQVYRDEPFWLIKDPLELQFYRLNEEEYSVMQWVDGRNSLEDIKEKFEQKFSPQRITQRQLQTFISDLRKKSLLAFSDGDVGPMLIERAREKRNEKIKKTLSSLLSLKWRGVNPDRFLSWITPKVGWVFSAPAVFLGMCCVGIAALWLLVHYQTFASKLPGLVEFFSGNNWGMLAIVVVVMKVAHELAHGIAFKRYGGECNEIGVLLMMGIIPTLYCSTTDSWLLSSKWQRAAIGAAGMYVEVLAAAVATFAWWFSQPGTLNMVCLNIMAMGSISVILINGNPFFKFDGYYIFSDVLELPNLNERAGKQTQSVFLKTGLGIDEPAETNSRYSTRVTLVTYQIASFLFKVVFLIFIKFMLIDRLSSIGLGYLGLAIGVFGLFALLLPACISLFTFFKVPGRLQRIEMKNSIMLFAATAIVVWLIFLVPLPHHVLCSFTIEPHDGQAIYVKHSAELHRIHVEPGQRVVQGQLIAELRNLEKEVELSRLKVTIAEDEAERALLESTRETSTKQTAKLAELKHRLQTNRNRLEEFEQILASYRIVASCDGQVIPQWIRPQVERGLDLETFDGAPLRVRNLGSWLKAGEKLCTIGQLNQFDAVLAVNEHDVSLLRENQQVALMIDAVSEKRFAGVITSLARQETEQLPNSLANNFGGQIQLEATKQNGETNQRPADEHFEARVPLPPIDQPLVSGLRGQAKILVGKSTLFERGKILMHRSFRKKL